MSWEDPVKQLGQVVKMAEERIELGRLLISVRCIDENDMATLKRLIDERRQIVDILRDVDAPRKPGDYDYKEYGAYVAGVNRLREKRR